MQPTSDHPNLTRRLVVALTIAAALTLASCGSSSSDSSPSTTAPSADDTIPSDPGIDPTEVAPATDVCAEVPSEDVSAALDNVAITAAEAIPGVDGSCQYFIDVGGMEAAVVQILTYPSDFLTGQRDLQTDASELTEVDGIALSSGSVLVATPDGTVQVTAGVELSDGGLVASTDQLVAVAKLAGAELGR